MNRDETRGSPAGATDCTPEPAPGRTLPGLYAALSMLAGSSALAGLLLDACGG